MEKREANEIFQNQDDEIKQENKKPQQSRDNNDLSEANFIIQIPTNPAFGSLNLAMAVNIICYEWFINKNKNFIIELENVLEIADKKNLLNFKDFLIKNLHETSFFDDKGSHKLEINVKNIFSKSMLTDKDLLILYGVIKSLKNYKISNWHIKKHK